MKRAKAKEIGEGVKLFYNGENTKRNGVGIAVAESLKDLVAAVQGISDRIMSLRLDTKEGYWTVMSVYAPQTGCPEHEKDEFYLTLQDAISVVHLGSALSLFLFVLTLDCIVNHLEEGSLRTILYADDIDLVADSRKELKEKTKFISSEQCTEPILDCHGQMIKKMEEFRYLGSDLSEEGSVDQAVRGRIYAAWLKWRESTVILCHCRCSRTLKGKLYRIVVRPALLYGSVCWALGKAQERQLHAAKMRMLRWACGRTRQDKVRNENVRTVMKTAPIQLKMREQRLSWYGYILRRQEDHPTKLALNFGGTRKASERSPKEKVERRHQERSRRNRRCAR
ncbi:unnamed protein product [Heligmosomoides polygyrus]|uniref:Reverse transcriptase domain-containing protein n=1 Tax=Heligmosomoides polygyrus TaxID=6339 RepID=A0A183FM10_HELPZ|nr:unnamed protein product [Heligmosomoides polygyrus]